MRGLAPRLVGFATSSSPQETLTGVIATASDSQALLIMLGSLGTAWGMVMAFWFGTTSGSARKTDLLAAAGLADAA